MKRMSPLRFHTFIIGAVIVLCHGLLHTEALAGSDRAVLGTVEAVPGTVEEVIRAVLNPQFGLKDEEMAKAKSGITDILPLLATNNRIAQNLGFDDATQIRAARVNEVLPFLVFEVHLKDLQHLLPTLLSPGVGQGLLRFTNQVLLPITVNTKVKSSLTLRFFVGANSQIKRWGSNKLIQDLTDKRASDHPERASFLVQVPALNRNYLGYLDNQRILQLVSLVKDQYGDAGVTKRAEEVFIQLSAEAWTVDQSPR